jgi:hypothetical protein
MTREERLAAWSHLIVTAVCAAVERRGGAPAGPASMEVAAIVTELGTDRLVDLGVLILVGDLPQIEPAEARARVRELIARNRSRFVKRILARRRLGEAIAVGIAATCGGA